MKKNIVKLLLFIKISLLHILLTHCRSVPGPIYPIYDNRWELSDLYPQIHKNQNFLQFFFEPYNQFYKENLAAELVLKEKSYIENQRKIARVVFELRFLNKNYNDHIRLTIYKGIAFYDPQKELLDLHLQDCYTFGNKNFEDKFNILEGWNCDHIVLLLNVKKETNKIVLSLNKSKEERFTYSTWFYSGNFICNPLENKIFWQGKMVEKKENKFILFGYNIDTLIKTKKTNLKGKFLSKGDFLFINNGLEIENNLFLVFE